MVSQKITVKNMTGFHLRPAGILCKIAMNYKSKVQFQFNSVTANAKSVLSVLGAGVKNGDEIEVVCDGVASALCHIWSFCFFGYGVRKK